MQRFCVLIERVLPLFNLNLVHVDACSDHVLIGWGKIILVQFLFSNNTTPTLSRQCLTWRHALSCLTTWRSSRTVSSIYLFDKSPHFHMPFRGHTSSQAASDYAWGAKVLSVCIRTSCLDHFVLHQYKGRILDCPVHQRLDQVVEILLV